MTRVPYPSRLSLVRDAVAAGLKLSTPPSGDALCILFPDGREIRLAEDGLRDETGRDISHEDAARAIARHAGA